MIVAYSSAKNCSCPKDAQTRELLCGSLLRCRACQIELRNTLSCMLTDRHCASKKVSYQEVYADSSLSDLPDHSGGDSDFEIALPTCASSGRCKCAESMFV